MHTPGRHAQRTRWCTTIAEKIPALTARNTGSDPPEWWLPYAGHPAPERRNIQYGSAYGANRFLQVFWYVIPFLICGISKYCRTGTNKTTQTNRPFFCGVPIKSPLLNNRAQTLLDFLNFTTAVSGESEQRNVILFKNLTLHTIPLCLPGTIFVKVESIYLNG